MRLQYRRVILSRAESIGGLYSVTLPKGIVSQPGFIPDGPCQHPLNLMLMASVCFLRLAWLGAGMSLVARPHGVYDR
jgi:hypothetical protein